MVSSPDTCRTTRSNETSEAFRISRSHLHRPTSYFGSLHVCALLSFVRASYTPGTRCETPPPNRRLPRCRFWRHQEPDLDDSVSHGRSQRGVGQCLHGGWRSKLGGGAHCAFQISEISKVRVPRRASRLTINMQKLTLLAVT